MLNSKPTTAAMADLVADLQSLHASATEIGSALDFEAELNAALAPSTATSTTANKTGAESLEVIDDDATHALDDPELLALDADLEAAAQLLGMLDGQVDMFNARLDTLLASLESDAPSATSAPSAPAPEDTFR